MKFAEAFKALGYRLAIPRTDWSAENERGVCISLWRSEIQWKPGMPWIDTRLHAGPIERWNPAGNNKRIKHLTRAVHDLDGWVDVVVVDGEPGHGITDAEAWTRVPRWRVENFDPDTGHFTTRTTPI